MRMRPNWTRFCKSLNPPLHRSPLLAFSTRFTECIAESDSFAVNRTLRKG